MLGLGFSVCGVNNSIPEPLRICPINKELILEIDRFGLFYEKQALFQRYLAIFQSSSLFLHFWPYKGCSS